MSWNSEQWRHHSFSCVFFGWTTSSTLVMQAAEDSNILNVFRVNHSGLGIRTRPSLGYNITCWKQSGAFRDYGSVCIGKWGFQMCPPTGNTNPAPAPGTMLGVYWTMAPGYCHLQHHPMLIVQAFCISHLWQLAEYLHKHYEPRGWETLK